MPIDTSERVFESEIEYCLTHLGKKSERYLTGKPENFDRALALDGEMLIKFVQDTQPDKWQASSSGMGRKKPPRIFCSASGKNWTSGGRLTACGAASPTSEWRFVWRTGNPATA